MPADTLLATGFVVDRPAEGTLFPAAGGNSGDPRVQAVYWRCIAVLFASARITNPAQPLALFTNAEPPRLNGLNFADILARYDVDVRHVPLTTRVASGPAASWGNVLYFFDIMEALERSGENPRFALLDSDVVITRDLAPMWSLLDDADFAGYVEPTPPDETINGLTRREIGTIARALYGDRAPEEPHHFGGEFFATTPKAWREWAHLFTVPLEQAKRGEGPAAPVTTEEHVFSLAFAAGSASVAHANGVLRRIWTSPLYNNVKPGDRDLPIWHLPAEKRYGLRDLYLALHQRDFPTVMDADAFRQLAARCCGLPRKTVGKVMKDGIRQIVARMN